MIDQAMISMRQAYIRRGRNNCKAGPDHHNTRLTEDQVIEIRALAKIPFVGTGFLAYLYGVDPGTIKAILTGKSWRWL